MLDIFVVIVCFSLIFIYVRSKGITSISTVPKTKTRWPVIGDAWKIDMNKCHITFSKWAKKLGPIFEVKLFNESFIVLNDFQTIHEALVENGAAIAGRPYMFRTAQAQRDKHSIVWQTYTPKLNFLRKEVLKSLRLCGQGLNNLEEKCQLEMTYLIDRFKASHGHAIDPWDSVYHSVCNVMMNLVCFIL